MSTLLLLKLLRFLILEVEVSMISIVTCAGCNVSEIVGTEVMKSRPVIEWCMKKLYAMTMKMPIVVVKSWMCDGAGFGKVRKM